MHRIFIAALIPLFLALLVLTGCDNEAGEAATQIDQAIQTESPLDPPTTDPTGETASAPSNAQPGTSTRVSSTAEQPPAASAYILILDAAPTDPQLLVQQLQQVLPKTMVVKQLPSPGTRDVKLEVTNVKDLRALANLIPFGSVDSIDERTRTITVDFDL